MDTTKDLIFFSNPFGYGPTAKAIGVLNEFKKVKNVHLHYVASNACLEIFDDTDVNVIQADQRNYTEIANILSNFENPYIVSSINKFAIKAAKDRGLHNCFIDSLTWMWNPIPKDYLDAEIYFALNFPGVDDKIKSYNNIIKVPYIIDNSYKTKIKCKKHKLDLLVNLGGCENPLTQTIPTSFLELLALFLNSLNVNTIVAGGRAAIQYLQKHLNNPKIHCSTYSRQQMNKMLQETKLFMTIPGLNASLEAFFYGIPTAFVMPTNLSQWKNLNTFKKHQCAEAAINWEEINEGFYDLQGKNEKESIEYIEKFSHIICKHKELREKCVTKLLNLSNSIPNVVKQKKFIKKLGTNGAEIIVNILQQKWKL